MKESTALGWCITAGIFSLIWTISVAVHEFFVWSGITYHDEPWWLLPSVMTITLISGTIGFVGGGGLLYLVLDHFIIPESKENNDADQTHTS